MLISNQARREVSCSCFVCQKQEVFPNAQLDYISTVLSVERLCLVVDCFISTAKVFYLCDFVKMLTDRIQVCRGARFTRIVCAKHKNACVSVQLR